jgi:hypothetical protein
MTPTFSTPYPRLRWPEKVATLVAWSAAVAAFATVGWMAMGPDDPRGVVRMTLADVPVVFPQLVALAVVVAGVVTATIGRKLPDVGAFAVALGLAGANLKSYASGHPVMTITEVEPRRVLCMSLSVEALLWFCIIALSLIVSAAVMRWCFGRDDRDPGVVAARQEALATADVPVIGRLICGTGEATPWKVGLLHAGVNAIVALVLIRVLATGAQERSIAHGQVYFSLGAAFFLGAYAAHRILPVRTALWGCLAVPVVCIIGYTLTIVWAKGTGAYARIASVPPTAFIRALPLEYIAVGTVSVLAAFWGRVGHRIREATPRDD